MSFFGNFTGSYSLKQKKLGKINRPFRFHEPPGYVGFRTTVETFVFFAQLFNLGVVSRASDQGLSALVARRVCAFVGTNVSQEHVVQSFVFSDVVGLL